MFKEIITSGSILLITDAAFLYLNREPFTKQLETVQGSPLKMNIYGLVLCYLLLIFGLYYFIIRNKKSVLDAFLLGVFVYGVYETTNYGTFTKWSPITVAKDTLWGGSLFAITTYLTYFILDKI
jgi:uncharacterized membrane protein